MKTNPLIKKFGRQKRWVNYRMKKVQERTTKVPWSPVTKRAASSTNAGDWATYQDALAVSDKVGIVFHDRMLLGIDIDHCLEKGTNKIIHEKSTEIGELIIEADSYTEISPSGEGIHIYLALEEELKLESNRHSPYEAYTEGRYFTFTGNAYKQASDVRTVSKAEALRLLELIGYPWNKSDATESKSNNKTDKKETEGTAKTSSSKSPASDLLQGVLTDTQVLDKMFASKGGKDIKALFDGDASKHENDMSRADMALLSHLAFWTRKDAEQMERLWLSSKLGEREKTQKRGEYRLRSIKAAIANCTAVYENKVTRMKAQCPDIEFLTEIVGKGEIVYIQNTENMCRILQGHPDFAGRFRFDSFKNAYEIKEGEKWRLLDDNDDVIVQTQISILFANYFGRVGKQMIHDAIIKVSKDNEIDSAADYFRSLVWDKEKRLDAWLFHSCGAPKDVYHTAVAKNWLMGAVKRAMEPGCKFDYVLVLEGPQGTRKSTLFATLGGDWHVESTASTDNKDFFMQLQGKLIAEFSEGEALSRTEVKRMKAIITTQVDRYRAPYSRVSQDFPRRCIFAMTTNQDEYLKDETGNRRWLPVRLVRETVDIEWVRENRDQLFAEAYHRVMNLKEDVYLFPEEETMMQQNARRISSPNQDLLMEWYYTKVSDYDKAIGITIDRAFREGIHGGFINRGMNKFEQMDIAAILKDHIGLTRKQSMHNGIRASRWFNESGIVMVKENETIYEKTVREEGF